VYLQAARLLGLGAERIVLLDNKTKALAKSQNTSDLVQVSASHRAARLDRPTIRRSKQMPCAGNAKVIQSLGEQQLSPLVTTEC
jgi:hypothetical protein